MNHIHDSTLSKNSDLLALERFVMENPDLDNIESELSVFNVFETLNFTHSELKHSNVLAWLLNPRGNHGLTHLFLKRFLQCTVSTNRDLLHNKLPVLELDLLDYGDIEIRREWSQIDLTIICHDTNLPFVVAIENKILSGEHDNQLERYGAILSRAFPELQQIKLFLTPDGRPPYDDESWAVVDYGLVIDCIENAVKRCGGNIGEYALQFIRQYTAILRRYIVGGDRIEELCRRIYIQHPRALDLIFEYKPDILSDIRDHLVSWINIHKDNGLVYDSDSKTAIRFTHTSIDPLVPHSSQGWTKTKRLLLFEFSNYYDQLVLKLYIGPGPEPDRTSLALLFKQDAAFFKLMNRSFRNKWHGAWQKKILAKNDLEGTSLEDVRDKIDQALKVFLDDDLPHIVHHFDIYRSKG